MTRHTAHIPLGATPESKPLAVQRIHTDDGSYIEPPFDPNWSELDQLRWHTGALLADTGIEVCVSQSSRRRYSLHGDCWGISGMNFDHCWTYLNGMTRGIELALEDA